MPTPLLGAGLQAIAGFFIHKSAQHLSQHAHYEEVSIDAIWIPENFNSRSNLPKVVELSHSIEEVGLLQPIVIRKLSEDEQVKGHSFSLVAGFRRLAAIKLLKWPFVPALILFDMTEDRARVLNLAENHARQQLRLYDTMRTVSELHLKNVRVEVIAKDTNIGAQKVWRMVRIWPQLSPTFKERWSQIDDPAWEPSLAQVERWSRLTWTEQILAWNEWAGQNETGEDVGEKPPETSKRARTARRPVKEVKSMLKILGDSLLDEAQKRALLWSIGKRKTL